MSNLNVCYPLCSAHHQSVPVTCCPLKDKKTETPEAVNMTMCNQAALNTTMPNRSLYVYTKVGGPNVHISI